MKIRTIAFAFGGAVLAALGSIGVVACSSDDSSGTPTSHPDASTSTDSGNPAQDSGSQPQVDSGTQQDGGGGGSCPTGSRIIACESTEDCTANPSKGGTGTVCCAQASVPTPDTQGCGYFYLSGLNGTTCKASCGAGEFKLCTSNNDCTGGQTCAPFKALGLGLGFCTSDADAGPVTKDAGADAGDAGNGCYPPTLHPSDGGTLYCPFGTDAGKAIKCAGDQTCCVPPKSANTLSSCQ